MIECIINGVSTYPDTSSSIKVTYENPYVKDSGSYTYEISFPMGVTANFKFFNGISRFEVSKKREAYEDCKLIVDNRVVISGKGTIKSITNDVVKLQIVGGASRIKYNSKWEKEFIDEIDYEATVISQGLDIEHGMTLVNLDPDTNLGIKYNSLFIDLSDVNYVGSDRFVLMPIFDETNGIIANNIVTMNYDFPDGTASDGTPKYKTVCLSQMFNLAPQPYLMYILNKVLEHEGFAVVRNDFDVEPWNRLVIANTRKSGRLRDCLPHWTVYNLIEEFRKLFNASFVFDEFTKTVSIKAQNELLNNDIIEYECEDEFTSDYDEDGLKNIVTSNLEYELADSVNRSWREYISQSVRKSFPIVDYNNFAELLQAADSMTKKERQTRIFHDLKTNKYYVFGNFEISEESEETSESIKQVGYFSPIVRDIESDESIKLKIAPVAMFYKAKKYEEGEDNAWNGASDLLRDSFLFIPSASNDKELGLEDMTEDENGDYYVSVVDAMQGTEAESTSTDDDTVLQVMFVGNNIRDLKNGITYSSAAETDRKKHLWPISFTDGNMWEFWTGDGWRAPKETASLSLANLPHRQEAMQDLIDKHNQITIKFVTVDIPDPSLIYLFHGKRYVCEKIEINIEDGHIAKEKTGYFYAYL
jgi:hypothetical protein